MPYCRERPAQCTEAKGCKWCSFAVVEAHGDQVHIRLGPCATLAVTNTGVTVDGKPLEECPGGKAFLRLGSIVRFCSGKLDLSEIHPSLLSTVGSMETYSRYVVTAVPLNSSSPPPTNKADGRGSARGACSASTEVERAGTACVPQTADNRSAGPQHTHLCLSSGSAQPARAGQRSPKRTLPLDCHGSADTKRAAMRTHRTATGDAGESNAVLGDSALAVQKHLFGRVAGFRGECSGIIPSNSDVLDDGVGCEQNMQRSPPALFDDPHEIESEARLGRGRSTEPCDHHQAAQPMKSSQPALLLAHNSQPDGVLAEHSQPDATAVQDSLPEVVLAANSPPGADDMQATGAHLQATVNLWATDDGVEDSPRTLCGGGVGKDDVEDSSDDESVPHTSHSHTVGGHAHGVEVSNDAAGGNDSVEDALVVRKDLFGGGSGDEGSGAIPADAAVLDDDIGDEQNYQPRQPTLFDSPAEPKARLDRTPEPDYCDQAPQPVNSAPSRHYLATQPVDNSQPYHDLATQPVDSSLPYHDLTTQPVGSSQPYHDLATQPVNSSQPHHDLTTQPVGSSQAYHDLATQPVGSSQLYHDLATQPVDNSQPYHDLATQPVGSSQPQLFLAHDSHPGSGLIEHSQPDATAVQDSQPEVILAANSPPGADDMQTTGFHPMTTAEPDDGVEDSCGGGGGEDDVEDSSDDESVPHTSYSHTVDGHACGQSGACGGSSDMSYSLIEAPITSPKKANPAGPGLAGVRASEANDVGVGVASGGLSDLQERALQCVLQRKNVFITGSGGVGKSHLCREIVKRLEVMYVHRLLLLGLTYLAASRFFFVVPRAIGKGVLR